MTVWVLWVLVYADGVGREWNHYPTKGACEQLIAMHSRYRDNVLEAKCLPKQIDY